MMTSGQPASNTQTAAAVPSTASPSKMSLREHSHAELGSHHPRGTASATADKRGSRQDSTARRAHALKSGTAGFASRHAI